MLQIKEQKAITLITLVITIIVMLILAGVTINSTLGENGIFTKAKEAKAKTEIAIIKEQIQMDILTEKLGKNGSISDSTLKEILEKYGELSGEDILYDNILTTDTGNHEIKVSDIFNGTTDNDKNDDNKDDDDKNKDDNNLANGTWSDSKGVNSPKLVSGLIPVIFNIDGSISEVTNYANWYDYTDTSSPRWANAVTKNDKGNITGYWVWIPRYEYRINSSNQTTTVKFIPTSQTTEDVGFDHIHPAFCDGSSTNYMNGEWDKEISGFWVSKFPAGFQKNTITNSNGNLSTTISNSGDELILSNVNYTYVGATSSQSTALGTIRVGTEMSLPVFLPLTKAYNYISTGDSYTLGKQVSRSINSSSFYGLNSITTDSHMLKNSEWGAVAYLTQSQYGRNGIEPNINNYLYNVGSYCGLTGIYDGGKNSANTSTLGDAWYNSTGKLGSSTANVTGVYDLNGCINEYVAGYIPNGNTDIQKLASSFAKTSASTDAYKSSSSKYVTVYPYNKNGKCIELYESLKSSTYGYGDAILETKEWYSDSSYIEETLLVRGGQMFNESRAGVFSVGSGTTSLYNYYTGFRVALVCE